jgi:hypothetical protein
MWITIIVALTESLPDPFELTEHIKNATGYGAGGLQYENWERALVQSVQSTMMELSNPGINYLIKHVGCIVRGLFSLAFYDVKSGGKLSSAFMLIPEATEKFLRKEFDNMLWGLMQEAANKALISLEPMYTTIDPFLPTFQSFDVDFTEIRCLVERRQHDEMQYQDHSTVLDSIANKIKQIMPSFGEKKFKDGLFNWSKTASEEKKAFLPDKRSSMMNDDECNVVIEQSYKYICALMRFQQPIFKFQVNHYLVNGIKDELGGTFITKLIDKADWSRLVLVDPETAARLNTVEDTIDALSESMKEVQKMHRGY